MNTHTGSGSQKRRALVSRGLGLLLVAACIPACNYGSSYVPPGGGGPPGATTLMTDSFVVIPFSGDANWSTPGPTSSSIASEYAPPEYHLRMHPTRSNATAPAALTRSTMAFTSTSLTVAVDLQATANASSTDVGSVVIESSPGHAVLARADFNALTLMLTFQVGGVASPAVALAAGTYYRLTFKVDSTNHASWSINSGMPTTAQAFATGMVDVALEASWAIGMPATSTDFLFHNVLVTTP